MLRAWLNRHPRVKHLLVSVRAKLLGRPIVSSHYEEVSGEDARREGERLRDSWQDADLPARQRNLVDPQLVQYRRGAKIPVFDVAVDAVRAALGARESMTVIEVGCSSGFYAEVFDIAGLPVQYTGCDYSPAFIDLARATYPNVAFDVADATALPYPDAACDLLISGCCLLHIPDFPAAIAESARAAASHVFFHRTPVHSGPAHRTFTKLAYGVETVEIHFSEAALMAEFSKCGLAVVKTWTLSEEASGDAVRSYLCAKAPTG